MSVNSRLKAIYIISQKKVFRRQRIQGEPNCVRKEAVDIDILITFGMLPEKS